MALISCPNCGKQISEKAETCPGCGYVLKKKEETEELQEKRFCEECGAEITSDMDTCPNCGCPIERDKNEEVNDGASNVQAVEVTKINLQVDEKGKKKAKKAVIAAAIAVAAIIAIFFGYRSYQKQQEEKAKQKYKTDLDLAAITMLTGASEAETAGGLIHDVWYDTIYENKRDSTKKYTMNSSYKFNSDFNTSLMLLFADEDFSQSIESIKSNQDTVRLSMKNLKNPPEEYEDAYDDLKTLYDWYTKLTELAVNPSGNLTSYTSDYNEADQGFMNAYKTMQMHFD